MTLQTVPAVPGIPAGWQPVQADFDLWVTDSFSFLAQRPVLRVELHAAQSFAGGSYTGVNLDTVLEDPYGGWSSGSHAWTCPNGCAGWYDVTLAAFTGNQASSTSRVIPAVILNGALWQYGATGWAVNGGDSGASGAAQVPLLPGDTVAMWVFVDHTVTAPAVAGQYTSMELSWASS